MLARIPLILAVLALLCAASAVSLAQPAAPGATQPQIGSTQASAPRLRRENPVTSIQEFVRIEGQGRSPLRGIGLITGLPGTGDSGQELAMARPLAEVYRNNGNPLADLKELGKARSAALVTISCEIPEEGGRKGDNFDIFVQASHSAKSLRGGTLLISPLMGPLPGQGVFAFASGPIVIEDVETSGRIRLGGQLVRDIRSAPVGAEFNLILRPHFRSYTVSRTLAAEINGITADLENTDDSVEPVAVAVDDATIHVSIPAQERARPTNFIASVLSRRFSPSLIDLPAMVVVNERTGSIIVTGDVEISPVTVGNDRLVITTTIPTPTPTASNPLVEQQNWTDFGTTGTGAERARIQDLLEAFKHLNVPVRDQIQILAQIYQTGRLHARFVRE